MDVREEEKSSTPFRETENKDETSTPFRETENKDETKEKGLALCEKEKGNDFYKHGEYEKAIEAYTQGMLYDPTDALLPANRAMAYLKLKRYLKCEEDSTLSLSIDPFHVKSYLRRATARFHLGRLTEAGEDYRLVLDIDPKNEQAMTELKKIEQYQQDPLQQMTEDYNRRRGYRTVDIQVLQEGLEADDYLSKCSKNPGHVNFIPVEKFTLDKLPADYRDDEIFQLIKAAADLTVRIGVEVVNPDRPEFWPYTQDPYPCYAQRGKKYRRCGTGFVLKVVKYSRGRGTEVASGMEEEDEIDYSTCPCKACKSSVSPSSEWYEIYVLTGAHVLFGDAEGFDCSCRIFYDAKDSPVKLLDAGTWTRTDVYVDSFLMTRVTCDAQLGEKISDMYKRFRRLWGVVGDRYAEKPDDRFVFIASHPHGGPKRVSYGTILETMGAGEQEGLDLSIWGYTTNTCPGSSGASVFGLHLGGVFVHNGTYKDMFNFATGYHVKK